MTLFQFVKLAPSKIGGDCNSYTKYGCKNLQINVMI